MNKATRHWLRGIGPFAVAACLAISSGPAPAAEQMRFYTMGSVGGGYDAYMRTIITFLEKRLGAKLLPVNENAAGGLVAMNRLINSPPDGNTILLTSGEGTTLGQLLGNPGVHYDVRKLNWLARVSGPPKVILVGKKSQFKTFADMLKKDKTFIWGGTGKTDGNSDYQALLAHALGQKIKIIHGYKGSRGMNFAIAQGEIDGRIITDESGSRATRSGDLLAIATLARERSKKFPKVPTVFEATTLTPAQARWLDWRSDLTALGRVIVTTPGVPMAKVTALRAALKDVLTDPKFIATARKRRLTPSFLDGETLQKNVLKTMSTLNEKEIAELKHVVLKKYYTR